jgi:hypothetical protein
MLAGAFMAVYFAAIDAGLDPNAPSGDVDLAGHSLHGILVGLLVLAAGFVVFAVERAIELITNRVLYGTWRR